MNMLALFISNNLSLFYFVCLLDGPGTEAIAQGLGVKVSEDGAYRLWNWGVLMDSCTCAEGAMVFAI